MLAAVLYSAINRLYLLGNMRQYSTVQLAAGVVDAAERLSRLQVELLFFFGRLLFSDWLEPRLTDEQRDKQRISTGVLKNVRGCANEIKNTLLHY